MTKSVCVIIYRESGRPHMVIKDKDLALKYCQLYGNGQFTWVEYIVQTKVNAVKDIIDQL